MSNVNMMKFMENVVLKNPGETEFHQAVEEVVSSLMPFLEKKLKKNLTNIRK